MNARRADARDAGGSGGAASEAGRTAAKHSPAPHDPSSSGRPARGVAELLYRGALYLYPAEFRRRYAGEMIRHFAQRRAALIEGSPLRGRLRLGFEVGMDLLRSVPRQQLVARTRRPMYRLATPPGATPRRGAGEAPVAPPETATPGSSIGRSDDGGREPLLEATLADLRAALRGLRHAPGFTLTVIVTLALGIGASAAVYSLVDGVLLEPLPYREPDRLVYISMRNERFPRLGMSVVDYQAVIERNAGTFVGLAAVIHSRQANAGGPPLPNRVAVTGGAEPESLSAGWVAGRLFATLGIDMAAGRGFAAGEDEPGSNLVVVISHAFAERLTGAGRGGEGASESAGDRTRPGAPGSMAGDDAAAAAVGRQLFIEGHAFTVIGVLPAGMREVVGVRADVWPQLYLFPPNRRGPFYLRVFGRLAPGVGIDRAATDLEDISEAIFPLWSAGFQDRTARMVATPLDETIAGDAGPVLLIVSGAVALVLLITIANVAGLTLARAVGRQREIAVRAALGAGTGRLVRFVLVENIVLAACGGLAGAALAVAGIEAFRRAGPPLPRLDQVGLDAGFALFVVVVTLLSGVLIGLSPLALTLPAGPGRSLREGARGGSSSRATHRLRGALVLAEFALTTPLLIAAGLLLASLFNLQAADPGFEAEGAVTVAIGLPEARYPEPGTAQRFWQQIERQVADLPGIDNAGLATGLPPDQPAHFNNFDLLDQPAGEGGSQPISPWSTVTPGFFAALGIPLQEGRTFTAADDGDSALVAVVTRAWADRFYPDESAVGKQMIAGGCVPCGPTTVVGVVGEVKYRGLGGDGEAVYVPAAQERPRNMYLVARGSRHIAEITALLRDALRRLDPDLPFEPITMPERLSASVAGPRHWTTLIGGFGIAAVLLVAVGIFGLLSYFVDRHRRDIGVRMALGADGDSIVGLIVRRGLVLAALGIAVGSVASLALGRWLQALLFGVSPVDPMTLAAVAALLLLVAAAACYLPARRAARISPSRALAD